MIDHDEVDRAYIRLRMKAIWAIASVPVKAAGSFRISHAACAYVNLDLRRASSPAPGRAGRRARGSKNADLVYMTCKSVNQVR